MPGSESEIEIMKRLEELEKQLANLKARLPAHSIPPNLMVEMDLLDEEIRMQKEHLAELLNKDRIS